MPRIKIILCSGICCLFFTAPDAQVTSGNRTLSNVVGYQIHQQKQWNFNQVPKNSVLYKTDYRYSVSSEKKITMPLLKIDPVATPVISKKFFQTKPHFNRISKSYLQKSRFLSYYFLEQDPWNFFDLHR